MDQTELLNMVVRVEIYAMMIYGVYRSLRFVMTAVASIL